MEKENINLSPSYVMKLFNIDKESIRVFYTDEENRRKIRGGKVNDLLKSLEGGIHFSSPFVINERNERYILLDGNHRFEAIKLALKKNPQLSIKVWVAVYRNLTKDQEKQIYKLWNIGVPQTATDFLKAYFKTIPCGAEMLKRLPVTIYGTKDKMPIKFLVGSHINAKRQKSFEGGYSVGKEQTISDFSELKSEDISIVEDFCNFMEKVFGKYYQGSPFYRTTPLSAFYRIWYDNRDMDEKLMINCFKKVFQTYPDKWNDWTSHGGRTATMTMYRISIEALNDFSKRIPFLSDKDITEGVNTRAKEKKQTQEILAIVHKN